MHDEHKTHVLKSKRLIIALSFIILALVLIIAWLLVQSKSDKEHAAPSSAANPVLEVKDSVEFPVYYSKNPPQGIRLNSNSVNNADGFVMFSYTLDNGRQLMVTQQPRPPIMERVNKVKEFTTDAGEAYIANLEGKVTGFILTDETLVIISNATQDDSEQLEQLLRSFQPV